MYDDAVWPGAGVGILFEAGEYKYVCKYYTGMSYVEGAAEYVKNSRGKSTYLRLTQNACTYGGLAL